MHKSQPYLFVLKITCLVYFPGMMFLDAEERKEEWQSWTLLLRTGKCVK